MLKKKLLFICTYNVARSRTAEDLFANSDQFEVKSAGMRHHEMGGQVVTQELINWADAVFVMETGHFTSLCSNPDFDLRNKETYILNIPDEFNRGDEELIALLKFRLVHFRVPVS